MASVVVAAGSLDALARWATRAGPARDEDVVVLPTAAAFTGATRAAVETAHALEATGARIEALMVTDHTAAAEQYFADRVAAAAWVVVCDGAPLHVRGVLRVEPLASAVREAQRVIAVGAIATTFGVEMIDPRGGAPTTGLGLFDDVVLALAGTDGSTSRSRSLVGADRTFVELTTDTVICALEGAWTVAHGPVTAWRGGDGVAFG